MFFNKSSEVQMTKAWWPCWMTQTKARGRHVKTKNTEREPATTVEQFGGRIMHLVLFFESISWASIHQRTLHIARLIHTQHPSWPRPSDTTFYFCDRPAVLRYHLCRRQHHLERNLHSACVLLRNSHKTGGSCSFSCTCHVGRGEVWLVLRSGE